VNAIFDTVTLRPGVGYHWGATFPSIWLIDGCKTSPYRTQVRAAAAPGGGRTFTVARGVTQQMVRLIGSGGAPEVEVRGPDGETVSTAGGDFQVGRTLRVLRQAEQGVTWIGVQGAKPGRYTVTPVAGSPAIGSVATAEGLKPARVKAAVGGSGARRVLRYDVTRRPGQQVTFVEQGPTTEQRLGVVAGGRGTLRFSPGRGRPGTRRIVARVTLGGLPSEELTVARYRVAPPARAGRPASLRVRRHGTTLAIRWGRAAGAARYAVVVTRRSGDQRTVTVAARRRSVRVTRVPLTQSGTVTVTALTAAGDAGRPRSARFTATRKAATRFRPFGELGRRR
jgi:hypothetical protein